VIVVGIGWLCCGSVAEGLRMRSRWTVGRVAVGRMVKASGGGRVAAGDWRSVRWGSRGKVFRSGGCRVAVGDQHRVR